MMVLDNLVVEARSARPEAATTIGSLRKMRFPPGWLPHVADDRHDNPDDVLQGPRHTCSASV